LSRFFGRLPKLQKEPPDEPHRIHHPYRDPLFRQLSAQWQLDSVNRELAEARAVIARRRGTPADRRQNDGNVDQSELSGLKTRINYGNCFAAKPGYLRHDSEKDRDSRYEL
jgi:hypothetical protein